MIKLINEIEVGDITVFWQELVVEAKEAVKKGNSVKGLIEFLLIEPETVEDIIANVIVETVGDIRHFDRSFFNVCRDIIADNFDIVVNITKDINAFYQRDPACDSRYQIVLFYKGFHALAVHRIAHCLWNGGEKDFAHYLNYLASTKFAVDIHPGARIDGGVFFDHGTGIVIGETSVIGKNVSILQGVTLGGTGKETKDRHPKIAEGVLIGAGAKLLGNIKVGKYSKVGAGTVLLNDVPDHATVVGVPGKVVGRLPQDANPGQSMEQKFD